MAPAGRSRPLTAFPRQDLERNLAPPPCAQPGVAEGRAHRVRGMSPGRRPDLTGAAALRQLPASLEANAQLCCGCARQSGSPTADVILIDRSEPLASVREHSSPVRSYLEIVVDGRVGMGAPTPDPGVTASGCRGRQRGIQGSGESQEDCEHARLFLLNRRVSRTRRSLHVPTFVCPDRVELVVTLAVREKESTRER